jgi:hypothetical protein
MNYIPYHEASKKGGSRAKVTSIINNAFGKSPDGGLQLDLTTPFFTEMLTHTKKKYLTEEDGGHHISMSTIMYYTPHNHDH